MPSVCLLMMYDNYFSVFFFFFAVVIEYPVHTPLQIQSQSLSAQQHIIPVDQLSNVTGNQTALVNDLESVSAPALQNEIDQQNDVSAQASADIESKDDLPAIQSEQNSINDNHTGRCCLSELYLTNINMFVVHL